MTTRTFHLVKNITINAPPRKVFSYWADFRNFQKIVPVIENIEILNNRESRWVITAPLGHRVEFESLIVVFEPDQKLIWESSHVDGQARGELSLTARSDSTWVELGFEYRLHRHWMQNIARVVNRFGFPSGAFDQGLARIKETIEQDALK